MSGQLSARPGEKRLILVLGGARSGKSSYAESLAAQLAGERPVIYVATATAEDDEMRERIARHRAARPGGWLTLETPTNPAPTLAHAAEAQHAGVALVDCLTLLVSNVLLGGTHADFDPEHFDGAAAEARVHSAVADLLAVYRSGSFSLILVSNEVGLGLVPSYPLGRIYRDVLGRVNARVAAEADIALFMLAGLPIEVKALSQAWQKQARHLLLPHE